MRSTPLGAAACAAGWHPGLTDLEVEKQVLAPQIKVRVDYAAAAQYGVPTPQVLAMLQSLVEGEQVAQIVEVVAVLRWCCDYRPQRV